MSNEVKIRLIGCQQFYFIVFDKRCGSFLNMYYKAPFHIQIHVVCDQVWQIEYTRRISGVSTSIREEHPIYGTLIYPK